MLTPLTSIQGQPVQGGAITVRPAAQIPFGAYSMLQNIRGKHPDFIKRPGMRKQHTVADGSNEVLSLYQFKKSQVDESYLFAQMSDGDILAAENIPPTVTTGPFGTEVFNGGANQVPASWSVQGDKLIMSNGVDQHQIYCGVSSYVEKFIVYKGVSEIPDIPQFGIDYSVRVRNDRDEKAILSNLGSIALYDCVYICTPVPAKGFGFIVSSANTTVCNAAIQYYNDYSGWIAVSGFSDGTASGGAPLAIDGNMTFTAPNVRETDENNGLIPRYQFGKSGFWYRLVFDGTLSNPVYIKTVTFQSDFQNIINVWDGAVPYAVEVMVEQSEAETWNTYGAGAVDIAGLGIGDRIMIASPDPVEGIYIDVGNTPSSGVDIRSLKYWDGSQMVLIYRTDLGEGEVGAINDGTNGLKNSGWITFARKGSQEMQFQSNLNYAHWYELTYNGNLGSSMIISIQLMPYFDIRDLGISQCNTVWKDRVVYSFDQYPSYVYISKRGYPLVLNGDDYGILRVGDGRSNKVAAMKSYKDFLMVWQKEEGVEGGCVTLFSGSTPANISRTVLSSRIGAMNAKCVEVVEGVETATADKATALEEKIATLVFFLSIKGVCVSNGYTVSIISDDIQNYFDPTKPESIRRGYEDKMWLKYDSAYGVLRLGLVSGSLATKPNIFPVYDLKDKTWSFDVLGQKLACMAEIEAGSENIPTIQVGGGQDDGTIYQLNYGLNDVTKAVESFSQMELNHNGLVLNLREFLIRFAAQEYGEVFIEFFKNNLPGPIKTVSMLPEKPGQIIKRERFHLNLMDQNISVRISCGEYNTEMSLVEIGVATSVWSNR